VTREQVLALCLELPGAWPDDPWDGDVVAKVGDRPGKIFAFPAEDAVAVKLPPADVDELRAAHPDSVRQAPYLSRRHWVQVAYRGTVGGDELRELGIVVESMDGADDLAALVASFGPGPGRSLAILLDHLVPGSKETRLAAKVQGPHVLVVGHPFVDIWQCVRPRAVGIEAWPEVPRGEEWKAGVCRRLGWGTPSEGWKRVISSVDTFADLEPQLIGAVETALDSLAPIGEHP